MGRGREGLAENVRIPSHGGRGSKIAQKTVNVPMHILTVAEDSLQISQVKPSAHFFTRQRIKIVHVDVGCRYSQADYIRG